MSHTLLSLVDSKTGQTYPDTQKRLAIFAKMLRSGVIQSFNWMRQPQSLQHSAHSFIDDESGAINILFELTLIFVLFIESVGICLCVEELS